MAIQIHPFDASRAAGRPRLQSPPRGGRLPAGGSPSTRSRAGSRARTAAPSSRSSSSRPTATSCAAPTRSSTARRRSAVRCCRSTRGTCRSPRGDRSALRAAGDAARARRAAPRAALVLLGMGGVSSPLASWSRASAASLGSVPFFVRIENAARFVREARYLRKRPALARLLDVAAATGAASLGAGLARLALKRAARLDAATSAETVPEFGPWADELWSRCRAHYSFVELRDAATLNRVYPKQRPRLRAPASGARRRDGRLGGAPGRAHVGQPELRQPPRRSHHRRLCRARGRRRGDAGGGRCARRAGRRPDDLNQSHPAWCAALRSNAFLPAPSTVAFAPSPDLAKRIHAIDPEARRLHLNRGDGDGPWGHDPRSF